MQQIGNTKSLLYGAIMIIIFMISSCEFGFNTPNTSLNNINAPEKYTSVSPSKNIT